MHILYVITGYGSEHIGYEIHTELAHEVIARGHAYTVFALAHQKQMRGRAIDGVEDAIPIHRAVCAGRPDLDAINRVTTPIFKYPWFVTGWWHLARYLHAHREFDVLIAEGAYPLGSMVYLAMLGLTTPWVINVYGGDFIADEQANYGYGRYALAQSLMRRAFGAAQVVRAESVYGAESAAALGCPPEKLSTVQRNIGRHAFLPAGTDVESYRQAARAEIRQKFHITAPRLIVTVGRLLPIKGFDDLIRALPQISSGVGDTQVLHVGPNRNDTRFGNYQDYLTDLAQHLSVGGKVRFAGRVELPEVRDFLAAADVVAIPSVQEGGTKMVMEAAAAGTPWVGTRTAGTPEWAREWNCGLIVSPRAPDELAEALVRILRDPVQARQMGLNGLRFAEYFRTEEVANRILGLAECALKRAPVPKALKQPENLLHPAPTGRVEASPCLP